MRSVLVNRIIFLSLTILFWHSFVILDLHAHIGYRCISSVVPYIVDLHVANDFVAYRVLHLVVQCSLLLLTVPEEEADLERQEKYE